MSNKERLTKIAKVLTGLKEALDEGNPTQIQKARKAVESAISPLKETYDLLSKTIGSSCSGVTRMCLENIGLTIRNYEGTDAALRGYPSLWDSLAKPEFISDLKRLRPTNRKKTSFRISFPEYKGLTEKQSQVYYLCHKEKRRQEEVGCLLGIEQPTVHGHLKAARKNRPDLFEPE